MLMFLCMAYRHLPTISVYNILYFIGFVFVCSLLAFEAELSHWMLHNKKAIQLRSIRLGLYIMWVRDTLQDFLLCGWFHSSDIAGHIWMDGLCHWHLCCISHFVFLMDWLSNRAVCRKLIRCIGVQKVNEVRFSKKRELAMLFLLTKCWHVMFAKCQLPQNPLYSQ